MKKYLFMILSLILFLSACGNNDEPNEINADVENNSGNTENIDNESENEEETEEDSEVEENDKKFEIDDELIFAEFKINMKSVEFYEEDGSDLAEVNYTWTNQSGDGKKYFFSLTTHDVFQGDEVLTETTGAADMENEKTNSYHEHNDEGGTVNIQLVYELVDNETPMTLRFKPMNEFGEDAQEVIIDFD